MGAIKNNKQNALLGQVDRIVTNYRMIADFNRRPFFVDRYEDRIKEYNKAEVDANKVLKNNMYFASWLTVLCVALYTIHGGLTTVESPDTLSLGMFLANVSIIRKIGSAAGSIYAVLLDIQGTFPALENIVNLINRPTDLPQRIALSRDRRKTTTNMRSDIRTTLNIGAPIDLLPIRAENVEFGFQTDAVGQRAFNSSGVLEILQGQMVSLVGPRGEGKSTMLKILGGVILPKPGGLFVPSHLRVLHVSNEPFFFAASLLENLTFGVTQGDDDGKVERVAAICDRLSLPEKIIRFVKQGWDGEKLQWVEVLSYTQKCLLCLARALVANPEVMCIHKPTMAYDEQTSERVMRILKEFCTHKGLEQDPTTQRRRRPRTCVMTSSKQLGLELADRVYMVCHKDGIKHVSKGEVSGHMLG